MFEESAQDEDERGRDENYGTVADRNKGQDEVLQPSFPMFTGGSDAQGGQEMCQGCPRNLKPPAFWLHVSEV